MWGSGRLYEAIHGARLRRADERVGHKLHPRFVCQSYLLPIGIRSGSAATLLVCILRLDMAMGMVPRLVFQN